MNRDEKFGRILAIANVLSDRLFPDEQQRLGVRYMNKIGQAPATTFAVINRELMQHSHRFGAEENVLFDVLTEAVADLEVDEFTNQPLTNDGKYMLGYYQQNYILENVMGVEEAAAMWGLTPAYIRNLCADGTVNAKRIGMSWVIPKNHPNPKKGGEQE